MKYTVPIALLAACSPAQSPKSVISDLATETVALGTGGQTPQTDFRSFCTGVWVGTTSILTAEHCISETELGAPIVVSTQISKFPAFLVARDVDHDLALLDTLRAPHWHSIAHVANVAPQRGDTVRTMSMPKGMGWSYSTGVIAAIRELQIEERHLNWIQATAPISPGSSGGGIFSDSGELIGVAHAALIGGQSINFFIHTDYIRAFLGANLPTEPK